MLRYVALSGTVAKSWVNAPLAVLGRTRLATGVRVSLAARGYVFRARLPVLTELRRIAGRIYGLRYASMGGLNPAPVTI